MAPLPETSPLENDPRNRCIGCGPAHPAGLHLAFHREGASVLATFAATDRFEGWPDRLHSGILYLALLETANWTVYGLRGRVGLPIRTGALELARWVATGESLTLRGTLEPTSSPELRVRATALDARSRAIAELTRDYALPDRAELLERLGYASLPPGFEGALPE